MNKGILRLLPIMGFVLLAPRSSSADTVLGTAELEDAVLLPGPNVRKLLDRDRLRRIDEARAESVPLAPVKKRRRITKIELVRVIPRSGNNPLNAREPINNTTLPDGEIVYLAVDEAKTPGGGAGDGGTGGGSGGACSGGGPVVCGTGTVSMPIIVHGPPTTVSGVNFDLDPCTLRCRTPPPGMSGQGNFSITYAQGDPGNTQFCAGSPPPNLNDWVFADTGTSGCRSYTADTPVSFTVESEVGRLLRISFKVSTSAPTPVFYNRGMVPLN